MKIISRTKLQAEVKLSELELSCRVWFQWTICKVKKTTGTILKTHKIRCITSFSFSGILRMAFSLPSVEILQMKPDGDDSLPPSSIWVGPLKPHHKRAIVNFWDRVYGIDDSETLVQLLSIGFLPDIRAAIILDTVLFLVSICGSNCYIICGSHRLPWDPMISPCP